MQKNKLYIASKDSFKIYQTELTLEYGLFLLEASTSLEALKTHVLLQP